MANEKYRIKDIYMDIFDDTEGYVDFYTKEYSLDTDTYVCEDDGEVVAMANIHYRNICYNGKVYKASYIYGVATRTQYRQLGIMTTIVTTLINNLKGNDIELIYLIPAISPSVYEKLGFRLIRGEKTYRVYNNKICDFSEEYDSYEIFRTYESTEQMKKHIEDIFETYRCRYVEYKVYPVMIYEPVYDIQSVNEEIQEFDSDRDVRIEHIESVEKLYSLEIIYNRFMYNDEV
jgi:predicted acetyltransferase